MRSLSPRHALWLLGLVSCCAWAQSKNPAVTVSGSNDASAHRNMSPELSKALTAGIKWEAPTPPPKKKADEPADDDDEAEDADKPRNQIIRLPKYVIQGERPPVFTEREINTPKGLGALAVKRYLSSVGQTLNMVHLPGFIGGMSNEDIAMQMYREDERLKNMNDLNEKAELFRKAGAAEDADAIKADTRDTYMRRSEFDGPPAPGTR